MKEETLADWLPEEIWYHTFTFLNKAELARIGRTNRFFYHLSQDKKLQYQAPWPLRDYTHLLEKNCKNFPTKSSIASMAVLANGNFVVGTSKGPLQIYDIKTGLCVMELIGHLDAVSCIRILPNGNIISASDDTTLRIWNPTTGECLQQLKGHKDSVLCMDILPNGNIVSGSWDSTLCIWDAENAKCLYSLKDHTHAVTCVKVLPNGNIVSGSFDKTLRIWNSTTGECLNELIGHKEAINFNCIKVLSNGNIVSGSKDSKLRIWDPVSGRCLMVLAGHQYSIGSINVLSNDNIISASADKSLRIWNSQTGKCLHVLTGHKDCIRFVENLPHDYVISASNDNKLRIWNTHTGKCVKELRGGYSRSRPLVLPDGNFIAEDNKNLRLSSFGEKQLHGKDKVDPKLKIALKIEAMTLCKRVTAGIEKYCQRYTNINRLFFFFYRPAATFFMAKDNTTYERNFCRAKLYLNALNDLKLTAEQKILIASALFISEHDKTLQEDAAASLLGKGNINLCLARHHLTNLIKEIYGDYSPPIDNIIRRLDKFAHSIVQETKAFPDDIWESEKITPIASRKFKLVSG